MHKDIFAAPIRGDEAKTLVGVVPLHRPNLLNCGPIGRGMVCGSLWSGTPRLLLRRGARIHAEDLRHLRPLRARAGTHLECRAGRHAAVATALNYAHMEKCIAGTVGQLDEAEAFVRVVPLDGSSNGRAGGAVELWTARRRISEIASWWLVVVIVEITAAARAKITVTATHGGTSFSTLRRYSVDHTIHAGAWQTFLTEVLAANAKYAENFGDKGNLPLPRTAVSRSLPAWMR